MLIKKGPILQPDTPANPTPPSQREPKITNPGSRKHREQLLKLARFLGLDEIEYVDFGNREEYVLIKADKSITIKANGNRPDGGFLTVHPSE